MKQQLKKVPHAWDQRPSIECQSYPLLFQRGLRSQVVGHWTNGTTQARPAEGPLSTMYKLAGLGVSAVVGAESIVPAAGPQRLSEGQMMVGLEIRLHPGTQALSGLSSTARRNAG